MNDTLEDHGKAKRFRSPPYPALDLEKSIERSRQLFEKARTHAVGVNVLVDAWGFESANGQVWRNAAALIQYSLLSDMGTGKTRKFQLTDISRRLVQDIDPNSERRKHALQSAALAPMIHKELWKFFNSATDVSDTVLKLHLTLDRMESGQSPYSDEAAMEVIQTYRASISYAGFFGSSTEDNETDELETDFTTNHKNRVEANEWDRATPPQRQYVTEPINHVTPVSSSASDTPANSANQAQKNVHSVVNITEQKANVANADENHFSVHQIGARLQISASVDLAGISKLQELLTKYKEILSLLDTSNS